MTFFRLLVEPGCGFLNMTAELEYSIQVLAGLGYHLHFHNLGLPENRTRQWRSIVDTFVPLLLFKRRVV